MFSAVFFFFLINHRKCTCVVDICGFARSTICTHIQEYLSSGAMAATNARNIAPPTSCWPPACPPYPLNCLHCENLFVVRTRALVYCVYAWYCYIPIYNVVYWNKMIALDCRCVCSFTAKKSTFVVHSYIRLKWIYRKQKTIYSYHIYT